MEVKLHNTARIWLIALIAAIAGVPAVFARDFTYTYEGKTLTYTVIDEETKTCKTTGGEVGGVLIIPSIAKDGDVEYSVTEIGESAFAHYRGLTSVTIGNSVTSIGESAFYCCGGLNSVTIGNSVTSIGNSAFRECNGLTSVTIPNSVTTMGEFAFYSCNGLTSVTIGNSVTTIGNEAFYFCDGLNSVTIGNSVTTIGNGAFGWCSGLTSVTIPNSVTYIGHEAFDWCEGLTEFTIEGGTTQLEFGSEVLSRAPIETLNIGRNWICQNRGTLTTEIKTLTIGDGVTNIPNEAFKSCSGLTSVTIPNSVTTIGENAFAYCSGLTSVTIPNSVTEIGRGAFANCSGFTSVTIPNSVTTIGSSAFKGCSGLIKTAYPDNLSNPFEKGVVAVAYPKENSIIEDGYIYSADKSAIYFAPFSIAGEYAIPEHVTSIGEKAFAGCSGLTTLTFPRFLAEIGANAFAGCSGLTTLTFPRFLAEIGANAFYGCSGLTSIVAESTNPPAMHANSFEGLYDKVNLDVPDGCLDAYLASQWSMFLSAKELSATDYTKTFNDGVFAYRLIPNDPSSPDPEKKPNTAVIVNADSYTSMTNADIPERFTDNGTRYYIKGIGYGAFAGCRSLTAVNFTAISRSALQFIGENAFSNCFSLSSITLPDKVESIGDKAFSGCYYLATLTIPSSVTSIGESVFTGCSSLTEINVASDNPSYSSIEGILYNKDASVLVACPGAKKSVNIPASVTSIGGNAFYGCSRLTSVVIPASVTSIGYDAFYACSGLKKSAYPDKFANPFDYGVAIAYSKDNSLVEEGFVYSADKSVVYFAPLSIIGEYAIPNSVTTIGDYAFADCTGMTSVTMGSSVSSIGQYAFQNCTRMPEIEFGPSVTEIGANAFAGCRLNNIRMGSNVTTIGEKAFDQSPATIVAITAQVPPTAPDNTFSNYTGSLYVQDKTGNQEVFDAYYDSDYCWYRFNSVAMIQATDIETDNATLDFAPGTTQQLSARVLPENATLPNIYWYSTNPAIASVDNNGLVTFHDGESGGAEMPQHVSARAEADASECKIIASTLYADGPVAEFTVHGVTTGVDDIVGDGTVGEIDFSAPVEVYNLNGVRVSGSVDNLAPGVYVVRQGAAVQKIVI